MAAPFFAFGDSSAISAFALQRTADMETFVGNIERLILQLQPPVITPVFPTGTVPPPISLPPPPTLQPIIWTAPAVPAPFTGSVDVSDLFPTLTAVAPDLLFPNAPTPPSVAVPTSPPIDLNFTYPTVDVNLPAVPNLLSLQTYAFNGVTFPTIDATIPTLTAVAPAIREYTPGAQYTSALLTQLNTSLQARIGPAGTVGTGLPPAVEANIWNREREREYRQQTDALAHLDRMEELGYAFPPGVFLDTQIKLQTEMGYIIQGRSRDVAIEQAKLEQTNIQEALKVAVQLEGDMLNYSNNVEQRIFESTKYATEAGIAIYNAQVQAYAAILKAYETRIQIYDAQIRVAEAQVQVYKTEIEAEHVKAEINTALVQQYTAQVQAALAVVDIFKAEIQAIQIRADVEKTKVEAFGEQIKAYVAQINAYTAQVEGYRAAIEAEGAKEAVYKTQIEAFATQVTAVKDQIEAKLDQFKAQITAKTLEYDGYKALVNGLSAQVDAEAKANVSISEVYRATISGLSAYNETLTKQWQVALDEAERVTEIGVKAAEANAQLYMTTRSLALDAAKVGAQVEAQLGAAAIGAINWSSNVAFHDTVSESTSNSFGINYNYSGTV
jgi:hypothetical protein